VRRHFALVDPPSVKLHPTVSREEPNHSSLASINVIQCSQMFWSLILPASSIDVIRFPCLLVYAVRIGSMPGRTGAVHGTDHCPNVQMFKDDAQQQIRG